MAMTKRCALRSPHSSACLAIWRSRKPRGNPFHLPPPPVMKRSAVREGAHTDTPPSGRVKTMRLGIVAPEHHADLGIVLIGTGRAAAHSEALDLERACGLCPVRTG